MTNKKLKVGNVPNRRFPGFDGEWESKKLGDLANVSSGGTPNRANPLYWNGNIPWISTTLIDFNYIDKSEEYITEEGLKNSSAKLFPIGTLLMAMYGQGKTRGKISILNIEATTNQACGAIITNQEILNPVFVFQNLSRRYDEIRDLSNQGSQENLSGGIIKGITISFPNLSEQQKISSFLTLIDERIHTQNKIIEQLQTLIKGLSEKLFSQKTRFKDFTGEWELKSLGELCKKAKSGGTPKSTIKEYYDGNIPFLSISDITEQGKYLYSTEKTISKKGLENSTSWIVPIDSIIYTMYASVGFVSMNKIELATSQAVLNLMPKSDIYTEYLYYYLVYFQKFVNKYITTGTQGNLNAETVKNFEINLPTIKEQIKIAQCLGSIDNKIQTEKELLNKYQSQKKHLLQNLFI